MTAVAEVSVLSPKNGSFASKTDQKMAVLHKLLSVKGLDKKKSISIFDIGVKKNFPYCAIPMQVENMPQIRGLGDVFQTLHRIRGQLTAAKTDFYQNCERVEQVLAAKDTIFQENVAEKRETLEQEKELFQRGYDAIEVWVSKLGEKAQALNDKLKADNQDISALQELIGHINTAKEGFDVSGNENLKKLLDKARALGVVIEAGKYQFTEEEKRTLKENIHLKKDSLEKISQLEKTDLQYFTQQISQLLQIMSSWMKKHKEIVGTVTHNLGVR